MLKRLASLFNSRNEPPRYSAQLPVQLGINRDVSGLADVAARLEQAIDPAYMEHVRVRVLDKHPYDEQQYKWMLLELQRFFVMSGLLKYVPMYSSDADRIWHEMILHTRDYEAFCRQFCGHYIHHQPHRPSAPRDGAQQERAMFDLVYSLLFSIHDESRLLLSDFFRYDVHEALFRDAQTRTDDEILEHYFNPSANGAFREAQLSIIRHIRKAYAKLKGADRLPGETYAIPVTSMLFLSDEDIEAAKSEYDNKAYHGASGSACSSLHGKKSGSSHDNDHSDSGSDSSGGADSSGGSSCSSCGGGCGSS